MGNAPASGVTGLPAGALALQTRAVPGGGCIAVVIAATSWLELGETLSIAPVGVQSNFQSGHRWRERAQAGPDPARCRVNATGPPRDGACGRRGRDTAGLVSRSDPCRPRPVLGWISLDGTHVLTTCRPRVCE